ncbi:hypothetical protein [Solimonas terrae]|uniref:Uncharacterized protein n=1 Tax=Solimonas terrae TaxID=1396819 RepID=A0A6M2BWS7_9GAMM|nr:hypothetical protein [Solimonas terrae]NGY06429.1 hypothetical protein [Solimonas terrae]
MKGMPNEPPDWWKRWRPLRWLAALIGLLVIARIVWHLWPAAPPPAAARSAAPAMEAAPTAPAATTAAANETAPADGAVPASDAAPAETGKPDETAPAAQTPPPPQEIIEDEPITSADVLAAYTARPPEAQRLLFFAPFRSYAGLEETQTALEKAGYEPQRVSRHARVPDGVPPSDLDILTVKNYRHLDQPGALELQFFNDRLYQVEFEPQDAAAYRAQFRHQWPQVGHEKSGRSEVVSGALRIASSLDLSVSDVGRALHTRPYVLWQDLRLVHQRDDWDYQFAEAAAR